MCRTHMWDETLVRAGVRRAQKYRQLRLSIGSQTISQRGCIRVSAFNTITGGGASFEEDWLCKPWQVTGTSAPALYPAVAKNMPSCFCVDHPDEVGRLAKSVTTCTFMPVCDKASGNLCMLRIWGHTLEKLQKERAGMGTVLYFPDTCGIHAHHRGKLAIKELRQHTMRHFSIANLYRLQSIQSRMLSRLEDMVPRLVQRKVGPPPQDIVTLRSFLEVLFHLEAPSHEQGFAMRTSQRFSDLDALASIVNGDLRRTEWVHWCWSTETSKPCCTSKAECEEKSLVAAANALFGFSDPIPAESRWTSVLANFKQTLLRKAVFGVGTVCFDLRGEVPAGDGKAEADSEAVGAFLKDLQQTRIGKTAAYYAKEGTFHELAVFAAILDIYDAELLFPMLGRPSRRASDNAPKPHQLDMLLDTTTSSIGRCLSRLRQCMETWNVGGPSRKPWLILDALGAPLDDDSFMRFARSQVLLLSSSVFRRYEVKYSSWPYRLRALYADKPSAAGVAEELLRQRREELDPYSAGLLKIFPTLDALLSHACAEAIKSDFAAHGYTVDQVERQHADITHNLARRSPSQNFANLAREALLRQACSVHLAKGGRHPLDTKKGNIPTVEQAIAPPFLHEFGEAFAKGSLLANEHLEALCDAPAGSSPSGTAASSQVPPAPVCTATVVPYDESFGADKVSERPCVGNLWPTPRHDDGKKPGLRPGLSPKMLELNQRLKAAKLLKGSSLTKEEVATARAEFAEYWKNEADHGAYALAYEDWRASKGKGQQDTVGKFRTSWGGGSYMSPVSTHELFQFHSRFGWPSDAEVHDHDSSQACIPADDSLPVAECANFRLWSVGASPKNVSRKEVPSLAQFGIVEKGLSRLIESHGQHRADAGVQWETLRWARLPWQSRVGATQWGGQARIDMCPDNIDGHSDKSVSSRVLPVCVCSGSAK